MKNFITNSGKDNLKNRLSELIKNSEKLKFLVGFFYFSGLNELYTSLIENSNVVLKVLVGLNVDKFNRDLIEYANLESIKKGMSNEEIYNQFLSSLKFLNTEKFDKQEFYQQVPFFIDLIINNRLIIRKTIKPNHAKLYIFKLQDAQIARKTLFITGSSNLTSPGISTQEEFNVEISDYGFEDADNYFNSLWDEAVKITENDEYKNKLVKFVKEDTLIRAITPFEAYALVLKIYLDSFEKKDIGESLEDLFKKNGYTPYKYQLDAIRQALAVIEKNNGVILADVVGLGKTVIACATAKVLKKRGIIICPPGIEGDELKKDSGWNMYKEQFRLDDWKVISMGKLDQAQEYLKNTKDIEVVIVDEAHRFRNQDTQGYERLKNICRNKQVILLTATPLNNKPSDILSLLKLFVTPKKSTITLNNNLDVIFKKIEKDFNMLSYINKHYNSHDPSKRTKASDYYRKLFNKKFVSSQDLKDTKQYLKYMTKEIRSIIEPVTIRRNRLDLQSNPSYKAEVEHLSKVEDPIEWFYELTQEQLNFYDDAISEYFANPEEKGEFNGAIYRPFEYEKGLYDYDEDDTKKTEKSLEEHYEYIYQHNLYDLMRRLLVKRFESSFSAFKKSIINFEKTTKIALKFIKETNKYILNRDLIEKIYEKDPEEIEEDLKNYFEEISENQNINPKKYKIYDISKFKNKNEFLSDIESDLKLFDKILKSLEKLDLINNDPKLDCLVLQLKSQLETEPTRKIVIFSEYIDTVEHLKMRLEKVFEGRVLTVSEKLSDKVIDEINRNFDVSYEKQENKYDILLSSDKLSEGFNLNRAGMVINYDIPWNPVRVIQRLGRINRISEKVFSKLYIVNFFPTQKGAELVKSREIASHKMSLIHNILGEDSKIFDINETPTQSDLYERIQQNPEKLEEKSLYTEILNEFTKIKENYPDIVAKLGEFPPRVKVAKKHNEDELLVFIRKVQLYPYYYNYDKSVKSESLPFEDIIEKIKCLPNEKPVSLSENFWKGYETIKKFQNDKERLSEQSLEQQAINTLKTLNRQINDYNIQKFIKTLLEDILDYGTLPDYTLRRIVNLETHDEEKLKNSIKKIKALMKELGEDYLEKEKLKLKDFEKEIIVAIENQSQKSKTK